MDITPLIPKNIQIINRYGDGGFVINEVSHKGAVLILPNETLAWQIAGLADTTVDSLKAVFELNPLPEILLIGSGKIAYPQTLQLLAMLKGKGIAIDIMDTGAACRTYNVLLTEGRHVVAALLPV